MKSTSAIFSVLVTLTIISCRTSHGPDIPQTDEKLLVAVSWYQNSAEMAALYHQGFNIARDRMDQALDTIKKDRPLAVVVDIDETMLDNSPYETQLILKGSSAEGWHEWTEKAAATALPGALEFAKYAENKGVEIFYITNRDRIDRVATLKNLDSLKFPFADEKHLLTRDDTANATGNTSSKVGRREKVAYTHQILLLIGDNLNDFSGEFEDRSVNYGKDAVSKNRELFGRKFIVLPNPMYGAWEKPVYNFDDKLSEGQKTLMMLEKLRQN